MWGVRVNAFMTLDRPIDRVGCPQPAVLHTQIAKRRFGNRRWRGADTVGLPVLDCSFPHSTYRNSFAFSSTWQKSTSASVLRSVSTGVPATCGLMSLWFGDESRKTFGFDSKRQ